MKIVNLKPGAKAELGDDCELVNIGHTRARIGVIASPMPEIRVRSVDSEVAEDVELPTDN